MKIRSLFIYLNLTQYGIFNIKINNERQLIVHVKIHYNLQRTSFSERRGMGIQNTGETPVNPPMIIIIIRPRVNIVCPINMPRCFFLSSMSFNRRRIENVVLSTASNISLGITCLRTATYA